jgi:hypothetical protein
MNTESGKKLPVIFVAALVALVVVVGVWWLWNERAADGVEDAGGTSTESVTAEQIDAITGKWRRPDGGYIIDIRGIDAAGSLKVAYYNPSPINVSQAQVVKSASGLHIFIELRDTGYPGATYRLDYDADKDQLSGLYHQPTVNQTFDVIFVRAQ